MTEAHSLTLCDIPMEMHDRLLSAWMNETPVVLEGQQCKIIEFTTTWAPHLIVTIRYLPLR